MKDLSDNELLEAYANQRSEDAFGELVARHVNFTFSAALRQLRNPHLAEEATQSAFIALAQKAGQLRRETVIVGWLHHAVHFAALKLQRSEARRKRWEEESATMNIPDDRIDVFQEVALPHLDGALAELSEADRDAVILRFFQQRSFRDVAEALGTSDDAAKKRVGRALERLRGLLTRRGITISAAALAAALSQLPVSAAPAALSSTIAALAASTVPISSKSATILNSLTKTKIAVAGGVVALAVLAALLWTNRSATPIQKNMPKINVVSVMVDDQDKALKFYTTVLGFVKKYDVPTGEPGGGRWLTVVSQVETNGTEVFLEPIGFEPARTYQKAIYDAGKPWVSFTTHDVQKEFERLKSLGVTFTREPTPSGATTIAVLDDTCSNLIQIVQTPVTDTRPAAPGLQIKHASVFVADQEKALKFYTEVLGFVRKRELPAIKRITVVSPDEPDGTELLLEPLDTPAAKTFVEDLHKAGIPFTQFAVEDVQKAYERMARMGVVFPMKPTKMGPTTIAMFDDTCGNLIQLIQQ